MTDKTETTAATPKDTIEKMAGRRIFSTIDDAVIALNADAGKYSDFESTTLAAAGCDSEGNFDPAIYADGMEVMVAKLNKAKEGTKAIVVGAVPTLETVMADAAAVDWLRGILRKELNHVLVRPLRDAENVETVIDQMPTTLAGFITSGRESNGIMESYNELHKSVAAFMAARVPIWGRARITKGELKRALESRAYALDTWSALEDRGEGKDSLFVAALQLFIASAKKKGLDPAIFERWMETRNAKAYTAEEQEADDFDIDSLTESLLAEPADQGAATGPVDPADAPAE